MLLLGRIPVRNEKGVGYGDSYLLDPLGEIVAKSTRHTECMFSAEIDIDTFHAVPFANYGHRTRDSLKKLGEIAMECV